MREPRTLHHISATPGNPCTVTFSVRNPSQAFKQGVKTPPQVEACLLRFHFIPTLNKYVCAPDPGIFVPTFYTPTHPATLTPEALAELVRALYKYRHDTVFKTCLRCGWQWEARTATPKRCPKCISPLWDTERKRSMTTQAQPHENTEFLELD